MKRVLWVGVLAGFFFSFTFTAFAWHWGSKTATKPKTTTAPAEAKAAPEEAKAASAVSEKADTAKEEVASAKAEPSESKTGVEPAEEKAAPAPAQPAVSDAELAKQRALKDKKRKALNNNQWEISVIPMTGKGEKTQDVLVFTGEKFSSQEYVKKGYTPSNYTLSLAADGGAVVESMQSNEGGGILFWRIELDSELAGCRGVLSNQLVENKTEDYSFVSTAKKPVTEKPVIEKPVAEKPATK